MPTLQNQTSVPPLAVRLSELLRLAAPIVVSRAGIMALALADMIVVGHFSAQELAYQSIGLAALNMVLVASVGLVMGVLTETARAYGAGELLECGAIWRRALPYAALLGVLAGLVCAVGEDLLLATGQDPDLAAGGGRVALVIGLGMPAHLLWAVSMFFLEAIRRPVAAMVLMLVANIVNVVLNIALVFGVDGLLPPLGAVGSAIATSAIRWLMALGTILIVLGMRDHARFGVRGPLVLDWRGGALVRRMGYAIGAAYALEEVGFTVLSVMAGWLGVLAIGAFAIASNLIGVCYMVALGIGSAAAVQVGHARGAGELHRAAGAGWLALAVNSVLMLAGAVACLAAPAGLAGLFSSDPALIATAVPLILIAAGVLLFDGGQLVLASALRGLGDEWGTTRISLVAHTGVMIAAGAVLALGLRSWPGIGAAGLIAGILVGSVLALLLLGLRFHRLTRPRR